MGEFPRISQWHYIEFSLPPTQNPRLSHVALCNKQRQWCQPCLSLFRPFKVYLNPLLLTMTKNYDYCSELMIMRRFMSCKCKPTHPSLSQVEVKVLAHWKQTNTDHRRILFIIQFIFTNLPMFKSIDWPNNFYLQQSIIIIR